MTALAGIWWFDGQPDADPNVSRMLSAQSVYGPHGAAQWSEGSIGLGRQLFRTLPEDIYDRGPVVGGGGDLVLAADVRLDNRDELADQLGVPAARALGLCDADILLAACERWGDEAVTRLSGDFAFALWDRKRRRLVLARDFLGQRPLHYHRGARFFALASMPKGLHALAGIPRAPDQERVAEFLATLPEEGTRSFFDGIERVEAGQLVVVTEQGLSARPYWAPSRGQLVLASPDDYVDGLRHHLDAAVRARLRGAGEHVGAHLSAGLDCSAVAATAARLLAPDGGRVTAFTAVPRQGYPGESPAGRIGDEGPLAAATAAMHPNIEHVLVRTTGLTPLDTLDRDFYLFERPLLNLCNTVWTHAINHQARARELKVVLIGQMGNMSISYAGLELLPELLRSGRWGRLAGAARALVRGGHWRWRGAAAAALGPFIPSPAWEWINHLSGRELPGMLQIAAINPGQLAALNLPERVRRSGVSFSSRPGRDGFAMRLEAMRRVDPGNYNKGALGGWGVDQRDPTADKALIEYCLSVPAEQFLMDGTPRSLARRALADRLPAEVLAETRKGMQSIDWHEGVTMARGAAAEEIERLSACAPATALLDLPRLRGLVETWPSGGWERESVLRSYRLALLRGISVGHFLRKASGGNQ